MLVCGQEEPIQVNEQLYALDEDTGTISLSSVKDRRLNRYSFIWLGEPTEAVTAFNLLVHAILDHAQTHATGFLAYDLSGDYAFRSRLHLAKRRKEGWTV